jgi:hypothetical protein
MKHLLKAVASLSLIVMLLTLSGWGFLVHRTTNQLAVYQLPSSLQKFFFKNLDTLVYNAPRPDIRRNSDPTEATKHFIDFEMFGDSAAWKMPLEWNEAVRIFTKDTLIKYGYVPYHVIYMKHKLTDAFKSGNKDSILFYAADIGHYIADANVPLHTSVNYDGQLTNQKGLHSLWESMIPEIEINTYNLSTQHDATYLPKPEEAIMLAVRRAYMLLPDVLAKEIEVSKSFTDSTKYRIQTRNGREWKSYSTAFAKAYANSLKPSINDQLINSANLTADFWYTSWVDAGKPNLENLIQPPFTKKDKKELRRQEKAFKANSLIQDSILISRRGITRGEG